MNKKAPENTSEKDLEIAQENITLNKISSFSRLIIKFLKSLSIMINLIMVVLVSIITPAMIESLESVSQGLPFVTEFLIYSLKSVSVPFIFMIALKIIQNKLLKNQYDVETNLDMAKSENLTKDNRIIVLSHKIELSDAENKLLRSEIKLRDSRIENLTKEIKIRTDA